MRAAVAGGYPPGGLMIDEGWEKTCGDLDFDRGKFPGLSRTVLLLLLLLGGACYSRLSSGSGGKLRQRSVLAQRLTGVTDLPNLRERALPSAKLWLELRPRGEFPPP